MKLLIILLICSLQACGMRGDLYLPEGESSEGLLENTDLTDNPMIEKAEHGLF